MPTRQEVMHALESEGSVRGAARALGCTPKTIRHHRDKFEVEALPDKYESADEIWERRVKQHKRYHAAIEARNLINVKIPDNKPIGILHFGDPHVDDNGTDLALLQSHIDIVNNTEGMYAANIGDITNNWPGGLARLYAEQSTSAREAWALAERFIRQTQWLYFIYGNHDCFSRNGNPLDYILRENPGPVQEHGVRLALQFPNKREVRIHARHNWPGNSIYNVVHGALRAAKFGWQDHIIIGGHKHVSGYCKHVHPDPRTGIGMGLISHCIQIASYKVHDSFAESKGFARHAIGSCCVTTINPKAEKECGLVKHWDDPEEAAEYLALLRSKA
jgi:hypothetical protein